MDIYPNRIYEFYIDKTNNEKEIYGCLFCKLYVHEYDILWEQYIA